MIQAQHFVSRARFVWRDNLRDEVSTGSGSDLLGLAVRST